MRHFGPLRTLLLPVALLAGLVLAACGSRTEQAGTGDTSTTTATSSTTTTAAAGEGGEDGDGDPGDGGGAGGDADAGLIITVDVHGGFVPVEAAVANVADTVVLGDGTVLSPAPTTAIFPGPAMSPFQVGHVDAAQVTDVVAEVEALDPDADYEPSGGPVIADAPDTTVALRRDGEVVVSISAYALGIGPGGEDEGGPRAALRSVVESIRGLVDGTGQELYEPDAVRVHDTTESAGEPPSGSPDPGGEPTGEVLDWPLAHDGSACTVLDDEADVSAALEVLDGATQLDWFDTDAGVRRLVVVPVLPGDEGCPDS